MTLTRGAEYGRASHQAGAFNERNRKPLTAQDIRFTQKGATLYAFSMGWPEGAQELTIHSLAQGGAQNAGTIQQVELLGYKGKVTWRQDANGLTIQAPATKPSEHAMAFRILGA